MAIRTVIMAGGAGTRLLPLTCDTPKPLTPLCGAPVMDYTLRLLQRHGIDRADVTLWYRPREVERCFGAGRHGVALNYVTEDKPVGTAGSVLLAARETKEPVLVLSGDGLTDVDLTAALDFHRARHAAATLALHRVEVPLPYGVVVTEADGRISRFIEKPDWSRVVSSLVNTGVYVLEPEALRLIPPDAPFDFGRDLFPLMLEKGLPLYGFEATGYWCDVGDPAAFLRAQGDLLAGRASFEPASRGQREIAGVTISADSFVDADARAESGAVIEGSCVLAGAVIGAGARLEGAIVDRRAVVGRGASLERGTVLGASAAVGENATLRAGVRVWPAARVPAE
ncbi:MAG: NDP-sugar synthase, partial [Clostridia bacterium]|nr:NDP-sugar synthase [Clostridia bacterium]